MSESNNGSFFENDSVFYFGQARTSLSNAGRSGSVNQNDGNTTVDVENDYNDNDNDNDNDNGNTYPPCFECAICLSAPMEEASMLKCGHSFCKACIKHHFENCSQNNCPCCRREASRIYPNLILRQVIDEWSNIRQEYKTKQKEWKSQQKEWKEEREEWDDERNNMKTQLQDYEEESKTHVVLFNSLQEELVVIQATHGATQHLLQFDNRNLTQRLQDMQQQHEVQNREISALRAQLEEAERSQNKDEATTQRQLTANGLPETGEDTTMQQLTLVQPVADLSASSWGPFQDAVQCLFIMVALFVLVEMFKSWIVQEVSSALVTVVQY